MCGRSVPLTVSALPPTTRWLVIQAQSLIRIQPLHEVGMADGLLPPEAPRAAARQPTQTEVAERVRCTPSEGEGASHGEPSVTGFEPAVKCCPRQHPRRRHQYAPTGSEGRPRTHRLRRYSPDQP
jgi:hypothetical protein